MSPSASSSPVHSNMSVGHTSMATSSAGHK
jgi:hypothetical protein